MKLVEGDNKTPKGMYFVIKNTRQFRWTYGAYYGGHWIKINYPNKYDADRASATDDLATAASALLAWESESQHWKQQSWRGGNLAGWIVEWDNSGPRHLSWGCVVMHLYDIQKRRSNPGRDDGDTVDEIQLNVLTFSAYLDFYVRHQQLQSD